MVATLCVGNTFMSVVGYPALVNGVSMSPTLNQSPAEQWKKYGGDKMWFPFLLNTFQSDWVFVNKWAARKIRNNASRNFPRSELKRGSVVVFVSPKNPAEYVIKRVVALENDIVRDPQGATVVIPRGHCWVEGDNANRSVDSRKYGPVSVGLIFGVASHIVFPFRRLRALDSSSKPVNADTIVIINNMGTSPTAAADS